ncbi:hypothetical protein JCM11641_007002 [Rhodosporidiobolus odoratus]
MLLRRDLTFLLIGSGSGKPPVLSVKFKCSRLKGKQRDESAFKELPLVSDPDEGGFNLDGAAALFALAIDDDAFEAEVSFDSLLSTEVAEGSRLQVYTRSELASAFVYRAMEQVGPLKWEPSDAPLHYDQHNIRLRALGKAAGITGRLHLYALRRAAANAIDTSSVTEEQRRFRMGHNVQSRAFGSYLSRLSTVDVGRLLNGNQEDRARFDALQGFNRVASKVPIGLSADAWARIEADADFAE